MRKKERWSKKYAPMKPKFGNPGNDRFRYAGDGSGKFVFYRGQNRFAWEPLECSRDEANVFVFKLNRIVGRDIERIARPLTEAFYSRHSKLRQKETSQNGKENTAGNAGE